MKRTNHTLQGLIFVTVCVLVGSLIYHGLIRHSFQSSDQEMAANSMALPTSEDYSIDNRAGPFEKPQPSSYLEESVTKIGDTDGAESAASVTETIRAGDSFDQTEQSAVARYWKLDAICLGGSGDITATEKACEQQERLFNEMEQSGLCWGSVGDPSQRDYRWHHCDERSIQKQPSSSR